LSEVKWLSSGALIAPDISSLDNWRATAAKKPVSLGITDDYTQMSLAALESYMQLCTFYGFFPSFFSATSACRCE
jgi:hypothetical protein